VAQQPTVGRAVHYYPDPTHVTGDGFMSAEQFVPLMMRQGPWHATIAAVWPDGAVNLSVTYPDGRVAAHGRRAVPYDPNRKPGTWSWPPRIEFIAVPTGGKG
jgi:hypothetical protein